jgi:hypothetical protein
LSPILVGTFALLSAWGRWGRGSNLGLPTISPMFGERALKTPLYGVDNPEPGVMAVDAVVCRLEPQERSIVIRYFQHRWTVRQFLREYHWGYSRYRREVEGAVMAVHVELD